MRKQLMFVLALASISAQCLAAAPAPYAGVLHFQGFLVEGGCGLSTREAAAWGNTTATASARENVGCEQSMHLRQVNFAEQTQTLTGGVTELARLWQSGVLIIEHS
ncbi:type 1 fimbria pilin [Pseudomonas sp. 3296]|uniref:hypothetical protein n=1 Tax=Pseudomonas sp. 3296 TaxID=2817753 RepID=UPI0028601EF3|nr:hypothetical protein [Pseudomonas sp. 3296]MDR6915979.1 type 1 fimbria pilin [Pseudomonas sp. 3296]